MYENGLAGGVVEDTLAEIERSVAEDLHQESIEAHEQSFPILTANRRSFSRESSCLGEPDSSLLVQLQDAFKKSSYSLAGVECEVGRSTILLSGTVRSYFALQKTIQLTREKVPRRRILLNVAVVPHAR